VRNQKFGLRRADSAVGRYCQAGNLRRQTDVDIVVSATPPRPCGARGRGEIDLRKRPALVGSGRLGTHLTGKLAAIRPIEMWTAANAPVMEAMTCYVPSAGRS